MSDRQARWAWSALAVFCLAEAVLFVLTYPEPIGYIALGFAVWFAVTLGRTASDVWAARR